jgi:hypothetical protein
MSEHLERLIRELDNQKRKYHEKMLSVDGEWSLFLRSLQIYDFMLDLASLLIPGFHMSALSLVLTFNISIPELQPLNFDFRWKFPTVDEWLKGVGVVIEKLEGLQLNELMPGYAVDVEEFVKMNFRPDLWQDILGTTIEKGYYGISRYARSYYDPAVVREFIRNFVTAMFKKHPRYGERRAEILAMARTLGVNEEVVRETYDKMSLIMSAHTECCILDYCTLDVSNLCEPHEVDPEAARIEFVDFDGNLVDVAVTTLSDMQYGCILDISVLDNCYLFEREDVYADEAPHIDRFLDERMRLFRDRVMITAPAFSNYVTGEEATDYHLAERTTVWGELMAMRYTVEHEVEVFLAREAPGLNPFDRRKYVTAVLQLLGHTGKRHRWGYKVYQLLEEPELKNWWLEYWSSQGLDRALLEKLYERVKTWLPRVVDVKKKLGKRVRLRRLGIPID